MELPLNGIGICIKAELNNLDNATTCRRRLSIKKQKMKKILIVSFISLAAFTCNKNKLNSKSVEYVSFGSAHGHCVGDCSKFFKIEKEKLYPDNISRYGGEGTVTFQPNPLDNDKYILAKNLVEKFSPYFLSHPNQTFGCPDCADQGGYHIEVKMKGKPVTFWHVDTNASNQPEEIKEFITELKAILSQL